MLVWRGYGIFVVVFAFVGYTAATMAGEYFFGSPLPVAYRPAVGLTGMLLAAVLVFGLHLATERSSQPRIVVDKVTGQEIKLIAKHDLFFIPIKFWPYVLTVIGIIFLFQH